MRRGRGRDRSNLCVWLRARFVWGVDTQGRGGQAHFVGVFVWPWRSRHAPRARSTGTGGHREAEARRRFPMPMRKAIENLVLSPEGGLHPVRLVDASVTVDGWADGVAARSASRRGQQRAWCMHPPTPCVWWVPYASK
eukprot:scaffold73_cov337-Pavlova_lutheri.AAC.80